MYVYLFPVITQAFKMSSVTPHFTLEETVTQSDEVTCLRSHGQ